MPNLEHMFDRRELAAPADGLDLTEAMPDRVSTPPVSRALSSRALSSLVLSSGDGVLDRLSVDQLEQQLIADESLVGAIRSRQMDCLEELDRRQVATGDGYPSFAAWTAARLDVSLETGRTLVRTMRNTAERPQLRDGLSEGVSFDRVAAVSRIPGEVGFLEHLDIGGVDAEAAKRVATNSSWFPSGEHRYLVIQPSLGEGWWKFWGGMESTSGALVDAVLRSGADALPDLDDGRKGDQSWRMATALVELCVSNDPAPAQVTVFVEAKHAVESESSNGVVLESGPNVARQALQAVLCGAVAEVVARTEDGEYMNFGRRVRTAPPSMRRALLHKYRGMCAVDGCRSRNRLQAHHVTPWAHGGETNLEEMIIVCWYHHMVAIHENGLQPEPDPVTGRVRLRPGKGVRPTRAGPRVRRRPTGTYD